MTPHDEFRGAVARLHGLAGALRREHTQAYARFTSLCLAIGEGGGRG